MSKVGNISSHAPATAVFHPIESCMHPKLNLGVIEFDARLAMITVTLIRGFVFLVGVISLATSNYGSAVDTKVSGGASWIAFDSIAYRNIVLYGYPPGPAIPYQIGYFPLFPYASRIFLPLCNAILGADAAPRAAMLLFSNACSLVGLYFVYAWARSFLSARNAYLTTVLLALYPGAVFLSAGLTEGPFLMLVAIALYLLGRHRLYAAAVTSALATLCRPTGVAVTLTVVAWTAYYSWHLPNRQLLFKVAIIGLTSCSGAISYEAFLWHRYQRYDAYEVSEDFWDPHVHPNGAPIDPLTGILIDPRNVAAIAAMTPPKPESAQADAPRYSVAFFVSRLGTTQAWNRALALGLAAITIAAFFKPVGYSRLLLLLPLSIFFIAYLPNDGLRASSIFRYESASLPLFAVMAVWLSTPPRKRLLIAFAGLSLALQVFYAYRFSRGLWVG